MRYILIISMVVALSPLALADTASGPSGDAAQASTPLVPSGDQGYWFYHEPPPEPTPPVVLTPPEAPSAGAKTTNKESCAHERTWTPGCGFLTPHSFAFQSKERDALLHGMVMDPGNPAAVKAAQKYMRWVVRQAIYASDVWEFNRVQDPSLSADAHAPFTGYGMELAASLSNNSRAAVWSAIRDFHGIGILFTKGDCDYCRSQTGALHEFMRDTGLTVYDASLQGPCLNILKDHCLPPAQAIPPAKILHVTVVPSLFLALPDNVWIRISGGLEPTTTLEARLYNFFVAWREKSRTGFQNGGADLDLNPQDQPVDTQQLRALLKQHMTGKADLNSDGETQH